MMAGGSSALGGRALSLALREFLSFSGFKRARGIYSMIQPYTCDVIKVSTVKFKNNKNSRETRFYRVRSIDTSVFASLRQRLPPR